MPDTSQFENLKTAGEKIEDTSDLTDAKVVQVMDKLTKVYNSKRSSALDLTENEDLQNVLKKKLRSMQIINIRSTVLMSL